METDNEIVVTLDSKKLFTTGIILVLLVTISYSYLIALFAFDAPSADSPLRIIQVLTLNASNAPQTSFSKGDTMRINSTIEKATRYLVFQYSNMYYDFIGDTTYRIIVAIKDGSQNPVYFQSTQNTISVGSLDVIALDYAISSGAGTGTYTYKVMVWSDWLPSGVASSNFGWEGTFDVS
ncbi:MAG: hypothetical protein ACXACP_03180 [Candidatus Hodarchaeales archaeon]|jgi:hypothetical protein